VVVVGDGVTYVVSSRYTPNAGPCCAPLCPNTAHYRVFDDLDEFLVCQKHEIPYLHGLQSKRWFTETWWARRPNF